jgi:hypothetical protein
LYRKVVEFESQNADKNANDLLFNQERVVKLNRIELGGEIQMPIQKNSHERKEHQNYVYGSKTLSKPQFVINSKKKVIDSSHQ